MLLIFGQEGLHCWVRNVHHILTPSQAKSIHEGAAEIFYKFVKPWSGFSLLEASLKQKKYSKILSSATSAIYSKYQMTLFASRRGSEEDQIRHNVAHRRREKANFFSRLLFS